METLNTRNIENLSNLINLNREVTVFELKRGAYDKVPELDFDSTYPNIILKKKILAYIINCDSCTLASRN